MSARHKVLIRVLIRARALRAQATARAVTFIVRASTNLSRAVLLGLLLAVIVVRADLVDRELPASPSGKIESAQTQPAAVSGQSPIDPKAAKASSAVEGEADPAAPSSESSPAAAEPDKTAAAPVPPALQKAPEWTEAEIADAKAECAKLLDKIPVVTEPLPPAREGTCGAPAPRELRSIGDSNVKLHPPATLRCPMIAALNTWVTDSLQPAARKSFGSPIARIIAGSYSCRNRYGLARAPISEHALMNAIDISAFVLANGKIIRVARSWTVPKEDAKPAAEAETTTTKPRLKGIKTVTVVSVKVSAPDAMTHEKDDASKEGKATPKISEKDAEKVATSEFLHEAHDSACKIFGTILGPDANAAHHDHFHLDMRARKYRSICQ